MTQIKFAGQSTRNLEPRKDNTNRLFCSCDPDLGLDPITLTYKSDPDILKIHLPVENEFLGQGFQNLQHYRQTDTYRCDCNIKM